MAKEQTNTSDVGSLTDNFFDDDVDFFGIKPEGNPTSTTIKEVKNDTPISDDDDGADDGGGVTTLGDDTSSNNENNNGESEEDINTFFGQTPDEDIFEEPQGQDENTESKEDKQGKTEKKPAETKKSAPVSTTPAPTANPPASDDKFFSTLAKEMKEKNIFQNVEIKDDEDVTEDRFFELQDAEIEARVNETFEAFFEELDEDGKDFLRFKKNGGRTEDFMHSYSNRVLDLNNFDEENEAHVNKVLKHYLSNVEKLDEDDMKDRLEWLKEGGKEKTYAKKYFDIMKVERESVRKQVLEAQEKAAKKRDDDLDAFRNSMNEVLSKTEQVGVFPITKNDQKELSGYILKNTVKVGKSRYIPQFQADISNIFAGKTEEDKKKLVLLAKLVKNNFDVKDLVKEVQTEVAKKTKSKLVEAKTGVKPSSSGSAGKKSISDYF